MTKPTPNRPALPEVERWPLSKFKPYPNNPRKHSEEKIEQFAKAILRFGFRIPILVKSSGDVVDGHFRLKAAERAGLSEVTVMLADDMSEIDIKAFRVSVNKIPELAEWSQDLLFKELEAIQAGGEVLDVDGPIGFELEEFDHKLKTESWDFTPVGDLFVVTITGALPVEDEVRERLRGLAGVVIECSTVPRSAT